MKTHRCKDSIGNASIRFFNRFENIGIKEEPKWWLGALIYDSDWDAKYISYKLNIKYCPYCGQRLDWSEE